MQEGSKNRAKKKKQVQGRKGKKNMCTYRGDETEEEQSNVKERWVMGVLCITIQDAFHCIAVAH